MYLSAIINIIIFLYTKKYEKISPFVYCLSNEPLRAPNTKKIPKDVFYLFIYARNIFFPTSFYMTTSICVKQNIAIFHLL